MSFEDSRQEAERLQKAVVDHVGDAYVEACPGAGKTRTLVHRVSRISKSLPPRQGIAVLSFTNSAVDEFKKRCHEHGILRNLGYPHFIGTFDGFLNHFLVMPFGIPGCTSRPVIVDSWNDITVTPGIRGVQARAIGLSRFDAATGDIDLSTIRDQRIAGVVRRYQTDYVAAAKRRRKALNDKGLLCADDARQVVKQFLADLPRAHAVGRALAERFSEVIVDEAQDCNADDVAVLEWLKRHGIPLLVVCDPDQAIFQFRKGTNGALATFVQGLPILSMNGNFRSSKIICALAGSMRTRGTIDLAVGTHHDVPHPIVLIPYGNTAGSDIGTEFKKLAADLEVTDCIVLAHKRRLAEQASGAPSHSSGAGGRLARLARMVVSFHAPATSGKQREATVRAMIRLFMEIEGRHEDEVASLRPLAESPEVNREYRRKAIEVLAGLPSSYTAIGIDGWAERARILMAKTITVAEGKSIRQALPSSNDWHRELEAPPTANIPCATVHEAKGRDYDSVCVVLDKDSKDAVADWKHRASSTSEALRVLYVGVTRAKRLLAIALPNDLLAQVEAILTEGDVPYRKAESAAATMAAPRRRGEKRFAGRSKAKVPA